MDPKKWQMSHSKECFQAQHFSGATLQPVSLNLDPPPPLDLSSHLRDGGSEDQSSLHPCPHPQGDTCQWLRPSSAPSPRNIPPGHILEGPQLPNWAGLTSQVEKHRFHSFHVKSSRCGLLLTWRTHSVAAGAGGTGQPASLLTRWLPAPSLPDTVGRGCRSRTQGAPPLPCPPQQRFVGGTGLEERAQSLMLFDHVFSLSHRGERARVKEKGAFVVTEWGPASLCMHQPTEPW